MASNAEIERAAAAWLARRESGWTETGQAEFQSWLEASVAHRVAWIRLETGWRRAARLKALAAGRPPGEVPPTGAWPELPGIRNGLWEVPVTPDLSNIEFRARQRPCRRRAPRWPAAAAAVLLATIAFLGWWRFDGIEHADYATALGETQRVALADGSVVLLSSNSRVDVVYSRHRRDLRLVHGEAFFEVAPNHDRPFVVQAVGRRVVAVGTRFSVRGSNDVLRVAVAEGRVRLEEDARSDAAPTLLIAGMVATASSDGVRLYRQSEDEMADMLSWRNGLLVFRSTPLADAVAEFNRYNVRKLVVDDPSISDIPIGGSFRWANTEAFVRVLEQGFGVRAEEKADGTHLRAR